MKNQIKRTDASNRTVQELINDGWVWLDSDYEYLIRGLLKMIRSELDREYWNKYQKEMESPFDNSGTADFGTDYLTIRSYNWDDNSLPNFDTDRLKIWWYKHSNRGVQALVRPNDFEGVGPMLANVLNNSIQSIVAKFENM